MMVVYDTFPINFIKAIAANKACNNAIMSGRPKLKMILKLALLTCHDE